MKVMTVLLMAAIACGGGGDKKDEKKEDKKEEKKKEEEKKDEGGGGLAGKFGAIADKAKEVAGEKAKEAVDKAKEGAEKAKELGGEAVDKVKSIDFAEKAKEVGDEVARKAVGLSKEAIALGKQLKDKLIEVHKTKHDYDLTIEAVDGADHDKKIRGMKELKVGDYGVGYKQYSTHPMGKTYNWQFQITWKLLNGQSVRASLYTNEELGELALAAILADMVPAANLLLK
jgi:hypothetical protein